MASFVFADRDLVQLRWLAEQREPMWGATPCDKPDGDILRWLEAGLIDRVSQPTRGYRITAAGRLAIAEAERHLPPSPEQRAADEFGIRWLQSGPTSRRLQVLRNDHWYDVPTVRMPHS